jgi:hypothetical protein
LSVNQSANVALANIPKELVDYEFKQVDEKTEKIIVQKEGEQIALFELQANRISLRG